MGLEQVKSEILQEAEEKADQIVEEAEEEAEEIREEAEQEAAEIREETENEIEEKKQSIERKALSNARMKAREIKLSEKQQKLDEAFRQFREEMSDTDREKFLESCLEKAGFKVEGVKAPSEFSDAVEARDLEHEEIEEEGVILESGDGERRQDFTFDSIVEDFRENLRKQVADRLFQEQ